MVYEKEAVALVAINVKILKKIMHIVIDISLITVLACIYSTDNRGASVTFGGNTK